MSKLPSKHVYLSYFARLADIKKYAEENGYTIFSIANITPEFACPMLRIKPLVPSWDLIQLKDDEVVYTSMYKQKVLKKINRKVFVESLPDKCFLLCYENPNNFCHRKVVGVWLEESGKVLVEEFPKSIK